MNNQSPLDTELELQSFDDAMTDLPQAVRSGNSELPYSPKNNNPFQSNLFLSLSVIILFISSITGFIFYRSSVSSQINLNNIGINKNNESNNEENTAENNDKLLGHLSYEEAPLSELKAITADNRLKLRTAAADKFLEMQSAARRDGVILTAISAFRTLEEQNKLFFEIKEQRGQQVTKRAEVSAPPGYSEHHTGYAIDIGDGRVPATNLKEDFERTKAFQWLEKNASSYSFELSFPKDNPQGVSYEPWHWRFVGDRHSLETFYKARNLENINQ